MELTHDADADAIYIVLRDVPYAFGQMLDLDRNIDFGADEQPIGIELLGVSHGVDVTGLPEADAVARLLTENNIALTILPAKDKSSKPRPTGAIAR
jgi:uncharacterized protein YuzE